MSDKIEQGIKLFGFIDNKLRDSVSAFLVGAVIASIGWGIYSYFRIDNEVTTKNEYKENIQELKNELNIYKFKLDKSDEDCTNRVIFFNNMIKDLQSNTALTKVKSNELAEKQKESIQQVNAIKQQVKQKVK